MKKVSIIVPVYNAENTVRKCIDSLLNQTYKNLEILLINDGSDDNSIKVLKEYESDKVKVIDKKNEGVSKTRNFGISIATGDYIMFVDNDDYIDEKCVENFVNNIKDNDVAIGGYKRVNTSKILYDCKLRDTEWSKYIIMAPWSKLYKKDYLIKNKIEFLDYKIGEDVYFNIQVYSKTRKIVIIPNMDYNWFYNEKSVSNTTQKGLNDSIDITILLDNIIQLDNFYLEPLNIYYVYRYIIWYLLFSGRYSSSIQFIKEYKRLRNWKNNNNIYLNINPLSRKIKGESFKNRMIVIIFALIEKMHLIKIFSKIYCKG